MKRATKNGNKLRLNQASLLAVAALLTLPGQGLAQQTDTPEDEATDTQVQDVIIVRGSRLPADISSVPGSVTVLSSEELIDQNAISTDLGRALAFSVPGFGQSSKDGNNFAQSLRGRKPAFFIDGLPQSIALRNGGRDLRIVHPSALDQIEVIRGSTAIYGLGGSGGVVNYITKQPTDEGLEAFTEIGASTSLTQLGGNSMEYLVSHGVSAKHGKADFIGNASYVDRGLFYDADGLPLPPDPYGQTGIADMTEVSAFGKAGYNFSDNVRVEAMGLYYSGEVDTDYTIGQGSFVNGVPSIAVPEEQNTIDVGFFPAFDFVGEEDPSNRNLLLSSSIIFHDVAGSSVKGQVFYQESDLVWRHIDFLPFGAGGFGPDGSQLTTDAEKLGARIDINTPIELDYFDGFVLWGVDYLNDKVQEGLVDGRNRTSELDQDSLSFFAQFQGDVTDWLTVRGGLRFDDFDLTVPDYESLDVFDPTGTLSHPVLGADLAYENVAGNFGFTVNINDQTSAFASWSEGFSIGDVVRTLRNLRPNPPSATPVTFDITTLGLAIEPTDVTSYEAGLRHNSDRWSGSITGFFSESDLGASFDSLTLQTVRAPEEIWGIEVAGDVEISERWRAGGSYVYQESKVDSDGNGSLDAELDFARVPVPTLKFYTEYDFHQDWTVRFQGVTLFDEGRFDEPFGTLERDIDGYTIFDLLVSGGIAGGELSVGVENVFNSDEIPFATLLACPDAGGFGAITDAFCNIAQPGARASIRYSINY